MSREKKNVGVRGSPERAESGFTHRTRWPQPVCCHKKVSLGPQQPLHRTVGGTTQPLSWKVESRLRIALGRCGRPDPSSSQHNGTDAVRRQGFRHHCVGRATDILIWQVVEDRLPWGRHAGMTRPGILMFLDRVWMTRKLAFSGFGRPSELS